MASHYAGPLVCAWNNSGPRARRGAPVSIALGEANARCENHWMIPMGLSRGGKGNGGGGGRNRSLNERLLRCHEKIRTFLAIAARVAAREGAPKERADAAADVARYFGSAFFDHAADEDESIFPRLPQELAALAARAGAEHVRDEPIVRVMIEECDLISQGVEDEAVYEKLAGVVSELTPRLLEHLTFEEDYLIPAVSELDPALQTAALEEMAQRRDAR